MKILIIDDSEETPEIFKLCCAGGGSVAVDVVTSGLDALSYLEEHQVDAVLVDLAMPTFDGISCVQEIRRNEQMHPDRPPVRLAFYTAHTIDSVVQRVMSESRVETVFRKPIDPFTLLAQVQSWLNTTPMFQTGKPVSNGQNGASMPVMVTGLSAIVVLIIIIAVYNNVLHKREEEAAYRYSEKRGELNEMRNICVVNLDKAMTLQKWLEQKNIQAPPELLTQRVCVVTKEKE